MININSPPILHRFRDIAFDRSKIAIFGHLSCVLTPPTEGFPWDDLRKILPGCQQMASVPNGVEILPKISIVWVGCTNVTDRRQTDRQTTDDRQTDGRWHIANLNLSSRSLIKLNLKTHDTLYMSYKTHTTHRTHPVDGWWHYKGVVSQPVNLWCGSAAEHAAQIQAAAFWYFSVVQLLYETWLFHVRYTSAMSVSQNCDNLQENDQ